MRGDVWGGSKIWEEEGEVSNALKRSEDVKNGDSDWVDVGIFKTLLQYASDGGFGVESFPGFSSPTVDF